MTIYNYYIDKRSKNKLDDFVDIHLEHPIETTDYEYLKVKLCDFKFLNNIYNISSILMNNQFNIRRYSKTYTYQFGGSELYFDDTGFFDDENVLTATETIDGAANTDTITNSELSLVYHHELVNEISYWVNILNTTYDTNRKMILEQNNKYFEIISNDNNRIESVDITLYKNSYTGNPVPLTIKLQRFNTTTNVYDDIDTENTSFFCDVEEEFKVFSLTYVNPEPTNKYRIICDTGSLPFTLYIVKLQANKQIPVFDSGTINSPVIHTITIPDGFYKSSNFKTTLNDLLSNFNLTSSIDQYNYKLKISNDNAAFSPTITELIDDNFQLDLIIPNIPNMLENWGITNSYQSYITIPFNSYYESDTHINLINLSKIIITTDLNFQQKSHNEIIKGNEIHRGFGNILTWIDTDQAPMTCIQYRNYENLSYKIVNKHIKTITLRFYNEKSQPLNLDNSLFHLQIHKLQKKSF